ncbi:glucose receptor git3 protein [Apiospora sp. TS-2023a]
MDAQPSIQSPVDTLSPACTATAVSPLLRLPQEIRNQIYSYFVTVDQVFDGEYEGNYGGHGDVASVISRLRVNRQIWAEVWNYLIGSNIWIEVDIETRSPMEAHFRNNASWYPYLRFPTRLAPVDVSERLANEVGIRISISENGKPQPVTYERESYIFAYHPLTYGALVQAIISPPTSFRSLTTRFNPLTLRCASRFAKLLTPLDNVYGLHRPMLTGVDGWPVLQTLRVFIARCTIGPRLIDGMLERKRHYRDQGHLAEQRGRHSDAMCQYWLGITDTLTRPGRHYGVGTSAFNSLCDVDTDMFIGFARTAHRHVFQLTATVSRSDINIAHLKWIIKLGLDTSSDAITKFVGLSDRQRRQAHLYRAFHRLFQGNDYAASYHLFYAKEAHPSVDLLECLTNNHDKDAYHLIQNQPGPQAYVLAEHRIPLVGTWRGAPAVWTSWHPVSRLMMQLFRQRYHEGPHGKGYRFPSPMELAPKYAHYGIEWTHEDDGSMTVRREGFNHHLIALAPWFLSLYNET